MKLYSLVKVTEPSPLLLTITSSKNEAKAYASSFIRLEHINHFKRWCEIKNIDYKKPESWVEYLTTCVTKEELSKFRVKRLIFSKHDVAETFRIAANCLPVGLSYEGDGEYAKLAQMISNCKDDTKFISDLNEAAAFDKKLDYILFNLNLKRDSQDGDE